MYGLIGKPIGHSFSARYFNDKFGREHIDDEYRLFPLDKIADLEALIETHPDIKGLNVTIPYKKEVTAYLDNLSDEASEIGAVNVIKFNPDGTRTGYNTDAIGFRDSMAPLLDSGMQRALVLGTGGASRAVGYVLGKLGLEVRYVSRRGEGGALTYSGLTPEIIEEHRVIVNTTPLGTYPDVEGCAPIPYEYLGPGHLCFDLVYNPEETEFMRRARLRGAAVKNGMEMLHGQAAAAWEIWQR